MKQSVCVPSAFTMSGIFLLKVANVLLFSISSRRALLILANRVMAFSPGEMLREMRTRSFFAAPSSARFPTAEQTYPQIRIP